MNNIIKCPAGTVAVHRPLSSQRMVILSFIVFVAALSLRLYGLGIWSFAGDEVATLHEERVLMHGATAASTSQEYRLPHAIPLGYLAIHFGQVAAGEREFGSRLASALAGSISVVVCFVVLIRCVPLPVAVATTAMLLLWPHHIYRSQETRFYSVAALFAYSSMVIAALAVSRLSGRAAIVAGTCALLAMLSHTVLLILFPILAISILGAGVATRQPYAMTRVMGGLAITLLLALVALVFYVFPYLKGWNSAESWGYSVGHAVLASVAMVGWGVALLALVGAALMIRQGGAQNWFWLIAAAGWVGATLVLPIALAYHPGYVFPLSLPVFVLAGVAIGTFYQAVHGWLGGAAAACCFALCLINLPGLVSHYRDGSRWPMREASHFVAERWLPGDVVAGLSMGTFRYYVKSCCSELVAVGVAGTRDLEQLAETGRRTWLVLESGRGGLGHDVNEWLLKCTQHRAQIGARRYDEADFLVNVYLLDAEAPDHCVAAVGRQQVE